MIPALYAATINPSLPVIDLHGTRYISDATNELESAAFRFAQSGDTACRVIYGVGTGAMRKAVIQAIKKNPMFGEYAEEESGGSLVVLI